MARTIGGDAPSWESASAVAFIRRNNELAHFSPFHSQTALVPT